MGSDGPKLVVGRVVGLEGGRPTIQAFPTPRPSRTERVLRAAQAYVHERRRATNKTSRVEELYTELANAIDELESPG